MRRACRADAALRILPESAAHPGPVLLMMLAPIPALPFFLVLGGCYAISRLTRPGLAV